MLLQLVPRVRRVALDSRVRAGQLDDHQRGHRDRGSRERDARETGESPARRERRREYRNLEIDRIPERGRPEERAEHARLRGVESEPELGGRLPARDDEFRQRHRGDDHVVHEQRESEQRRHQPPAERVDRLEHEQERGERPQPRHEEDRAAVEQRLRGVADNERGNEQQAGDARDRLERARSAPQLRDSPRHQDVPRDHRDREGEVDGPEQPVRGHRAKLDTRARAGKRSQPLVLFGRMNRSALFTLPNTISLSRVVLALAFVLVSEPWDRIAP